MIKKEIGKTFPNLNRAIAHYSPISLYITLNQIEENEIAYLFSEKRDMDIVRKASIYLHELRHNIDHLGTLWGQKNLFKLSQAINARISKDENEFHKILPFKKEEHQFHYDEYYTENYLITEYKGPADIWTWQLSSGLKFDINGLIDPKEPIPFIKFAKKSGVQVVRVPLSIAALLEANSTFDEYKHIIDHINSLEPMAKAIEQRLLNDSIFKEFIYNQHLAVYNSIVHLTANLLEISDVIIALEIAASISTLTLNLHYDLLTLIPINEIAQKHWGERNLSMLKNSEYGYVFYLLLSNYRASYLKSRRYDLMELLEANKLPTDTEILNKVLEEFNYIESEVGKLICLNTDFKNFVNTGRNILNLRGIDGTKTSTEDLIKSQHFTPDLVCSDTDFDLKKFTFGGIVNNPPQSLTPEERYSFSDLINSKLEEFYKIRGL
jgi:hypothetical protein